GSHAQHLEVIQSLRELSQELKAPVSILQDLQGPKIRVGKFEGGGIQLVEGEKVIITDEKIAGRPGVIPIDFDGLIESAKPGQRVLLDGGLMELQITGRDSENRLIAEVLSGGLLKDRKGMNAPGASLPIDCLTPK